MGVITAKTEIAEDGTSAWSETADLTNISIGVSGKAYHVEFNLGSDLIYAHPGESSDQNVTVVLANAAQVRVVNDGSGSIFYEVYN